MTLECTIVLACTVAAASGCGCACVDVVFETACRERRGEVRELEASRLCVTDAGVVATWVVEDDDGGAPP